MRLIPQKYILRHALIDTSLPATDFPQYTHPTTIPIQRTLRQIPQLEVNERVLVRPITAQ